jgi:hypothetical protein
MPRSLNTIVGNAKRFMAYEIIKRLKTNKEIDLLDDLYYSVKKNERKKGQIHKVFEDSFEAKECYSEVFALQKLNYIHKNPVSKKWQLVRDYTDYPYSSAVFYEKGINTYDKLIHIYKVIR